MPSNGQLALLFFAVALFAAGGLLSFLRLWKFPVSSTLASRSLLVSGIIACIAVLLWHSSTRGRWIPIGDNFDALIWLAVLLAIFVAYIQNTRPLAALDWFVMPVVILLLISAAIFGRADFHRYGAQAWTTVHRISAYGGSVAFAVAAATGAMYMLVSFRLRRKQPFAPALGSLERLENLTMHAVTLGFALLTIGIVTGAIEQFGKGKTTSTTKIALTVAVWLVYGLVLHAPINPVFRGRRAAMLSIFGFVLMIGAIIAAQFGPTGGAH